MRLGGAAKRATQRFRDWPRGLVPGRSGTGTGPGDPGFHPKKPRTGLRVAGAGPEMPGTGPGVPGAGPGAYGLHTLLRYPTVCPQADQRMRNTADTQLYWDMRMV
jgi:hypothetical protein